MEKIVNGFQDDNVVPKEEFDVALWNRFKEGKIRNVYPKSKYDHILKTIKTMAVNPPINSPGEYYLLRKFIVTKIGDGERLACKNDGTGNFYIALEEIYDFIEDAHRSTNHGGRDKIARVLQQTGVMNVARETIELFLSFCEVCRPRKEPPIRRTFKSYIHNSPHDTGDSSNHGTNTTVEDTVSGHSQDETPLNAETNEPKDNNVSSEGDITLKRGHVAILDLTASPDGDYKFILLYLDYQTQFCILRPIKCKCTMEISSHLLDIFTFIGPPQVLHSDYDSPFLLTVVEELKKNWPECVLVFSKQKYFPDVAKQCINDVEKLLRSWILDSGSHRWSFGLRFVQLRKNTKITDSSKQSPYERFFGKPLHKLPSYLNAASLSSTHKEEELLNAIIKHRGRQVCILEERCEQLQVSLDPDVCSMVQKDEAQVPLENDHSGEGIPLKNNPVDITIVKAEPDSDLDE